MAALVCADLAVAVVRLAVSCSSVSGGAAVGFAMEANNPAVVDDAVDDGDGQSIRHSLGLIV